MRGLSVNDKDHHYHIIYYIITFIILSAAEDIPTKETGATAISDSLSTSVTGVC